MFELLHLACAQLAAFCARSDFWPWLFEEVHKKHDQMRAADEIVTEMVQRVSTDVRPDAVSQDFNWMTTLELHGRVMNVLSV